MIGKILQSKVGTLLVSSRAPVDNDETPSTINGTIVGDSQKLNSNESSRNWLLLHPSDAPELFQGYPAPLLHVATACCVVFILLGIPGNLGTIVALYRCKKVRNATAVFIINLSFSDLMFCCFNLPLAASTFYYRAWRHGILLCQLFPLLRYGLLAVSLFTVLAITINRYVMIGHPTLYPKLYRTEYLGLMVACTWISGFGALGATWYGAWGQFGLDQDIGSCSILPDRNGNSPKTFLFLVAFVIPCISIIVCYARIFYIVRKTALKSRAAPRSSVPCSKLTSVDTSKYKSSSCEDSAIGTSTTGASTDRSSSVYLDVRLSPGHLHTEIQQNIINSRVDRYAIKAERVHFTVGHKVSKDKQVKRAHSDSKLNVAERRPLCQHRKSVEIQQKKYYISSSPVSPVYMHPHDEPRAVETCLLAPPVIIRSGGDLSTSCSFDETFNSSQRSPNLKKHKRMTSVFRSHGSPWKSKPVVHQPGKMTAKDKKLLKMILVIFLSFLVCYLPITISKTFRNVLEMPVLDIAGYILIYLTTCMNPIIYVVMSSEYRQAYKNLLMCRNGDHSQQNRSGSQK